MPNDGKSKQNLYKKNKQYQDRLPFWPDEYYEQANPLTRAGLFSISTKKKEHSEWTEMSVLGEGKLEYMGQRLNTFDEDVFLQLLHYSRGSSLLRAIQVEKAQFLRDLYQTTGGKNYKKLDSSINRLESGVLRVSSRHVLRKLVELMDNPGLSDKMEPRFIKELKDKYEEFNSQIRQALEDGDDYSITVRFIQNTGDNGTSNQLCLFLDPLMVLLFDGINTTRTDRLERKVLTPTEKRLLSYIHSHSIELHPIKIESVFNLLGADFSFIRYKKRFITSLTKSLETLEKLGRIKPGWQIENDKITGLKAVSYHSN